MIEAPVHLLRKDSDDLAMWAEVHASDEYKLVAEDVAGRVVLDVGGGVGAFASLCVALGAEKVVSVEPNADTCETYRRVMACDLRDCRAVLVEGAAWSGDGHGTLRMNSTHRGHDSVVLDFPDSQPCRLVSFQSLLDEWRPSAVKVDAEASEYEMLMPLPRLGGVRVMWVEFHETKRTDPTPHHKMNKVVNDLKADGFAAERIKNEDGVIWRFRRDA